MKPQNFYEVKIGGESAYGSESATETIKFFRATPNARLIVTVWDSDSGEDMVLLNDQVDITEIILATITNQMERSALV